VTHDPSVLKRRLAAGETVVGTFLKTPHSAAAEILARTPLGVVCIDAEHAPFDRRDVDAAVMALGAGGMPSLVRTPSADPAHILSALDCGATGVVVPHIRTAAEAEAAVRAAHFGPGGRGYAGSTRAAGFAGRPIAEHMARSRAATVVVAQIEDAEALSALDAIMAVDGLDAVFIGRIDLTVSLGADRPDAPEVVEAVEAIVAAARAAGRPVGMFTPTVAEALSWREKGASLFLLGSDQSFMLAGAAALADAFSRGSDPGAAAG
jgi:2-keto-3-deoxy-L-rhamnonate aldolase RhmA